MPAATFLWLRVRIVVKKLPGDGLSQSNETVLLLSAGHQLHQLLYARSYRSPLVIFA